MHLESLSNELLLDHLLLIHFRTYRFDFRSICKRDFDMTCQYYLPFLVDRLISFNLFNDDDSPNPPQKLLSYSFTRL
jgi:hypothetical protein